MRTRMPVLAVGVVSLLLGASACAQDAPAAFQLGWFHRPDGDAILISPAPGEGYRQLDFVNAEFGSIQIGQGEDAFRQVQTPDGPALRSRDGALLVRSAAPPYEVTEVGFEAMDGVRLEGVLLLPSVPASRGAVVLHGSGSSDRDNVWAYTFAHALAMSGIAVPFPDKRGSGGSSGDWQTVGFDALARDAVVAAGELARRTFLSADSVGWVGLSQGGWIAPLAARVSGNGAFVVSVSSAAVPVFDQLEHEVTNSLRADGLDAEGLAAAAELQEAFRRRALGEIPWSAYEAVRQRALTGPAAAFAEATPADSSSSQWLWWARVGGHDPIESWARADLPSLIVYGAEDESDNVPVAASVARLRTLRDRPLLGRRIEFEVYPNMGHTLVDPETGWVSAAVLSRITEFAGGRPVESGGGTGTARSPEGRVAPIVGSASLHQGPWFPLSPTERPNPPTRSRSTPPHPPQGSGR